ncbi:hypothetical protein C8A05DRAFT_14190 [Staphylotrichum tortipilum]|uniref:E3 ubiquitin-protein ligase UBR1-like winged-helix domain-containing protein n=1 Tax=Staphylotrichum tortipilum TaxID=2831512 RepID=A0AAN6MQ26_9PEZI|nr:hypothetical protein C8A05DRAFT_14190 [Staphylotrichum longicolle]
MLNISESGMLLESSANPMAGLPAQAFAISLSASVIDDMIACVQNGGDIQLALGSSPKFLFDDSEIRIPKTSDPSGYDLFLTNHENPSSATKLPSPTMSILKVPKRQPKPKLARPSKPAPKNEPAQAPAKSSTAAPEDAAARLQRSLANLAADKRENSAVIVGGLPSSKGGKFNKANSRLLDAHAAASPRSLPPSPALSGIGSPSLLPPGSTSQERVKQHRFPIMHELAAEDLSRQDLFARWDEGTEEEFSQALTKVADFIQETQKYSLKRMCWKDLDIFEYNYARDEDRQKAINNAIRQYDRMRISASDPLWQKLLPKADRGKGICLSKLQAALAKGPTAPAPKQASPSGGDSERDDSAGSGMKKGKGGEPMSRSSSQTSTGKKKLSASEAQAKRMLSTTKKKPAAAAATTIKTAPKSSTTKAAPKAGPAKGGRVLSKEFVSDSGSSDDEVPLSTSMGKPKPAAAKPMQRAAEKPKATEKLKDTLPLKPKPAAAAKPSPREPEKREKEKETIRAQVVAKPIKPSAKRPRDADDDSSSSSGTPLSKRVKPVAKPLTISAGSDKARAGSDASQNSRGASLGVTAAPKTKSTPPVRSSPLGLSPPTNASDMEQDRAALARREQREREQREKEREREQRERDRDRRRDNAVRSSSSSSSATDSSAGSRKRPAMDSLASNKTKRHRPSQETMDLAARFKQSYSRYQQLHRDITALDNPDPSKVTDLLDMHERLSRMKTEIYAAVEA